VSFVKFQNRLCTPSRRHQGTFTTARASPPQVNARSILSDRPQPISSRHGHIYAPDDNKGEAMPWRRPLPSQSRVATGTRRQSPYPATSRRLGTHRRARELELHSAAIDEGGGGEHPLPPSLRAYRPQRGRRGCGWRRLGFECWPVSPGAEDARCGVSHLIPFLLFIFPDCWRELF
jgi:hypothetical protein